MKYTRLLINAVLVTAAMLTSLGAAAQYGNTVREDRMWDYRLKVNGLGDAGFEKDLKGYHFNGTKEINGISYAIFRDGEGNELVPVRQDGGKIYIYVAPFDEAAAPDTQLQIVSDTEGWELITGDVLVYDFSLSPGESYKAPAFDEIEGFYGIMVDYEVIATSVEYYDGTPYDCMTVRCDCTGEAEIKAINGIGTLSGLLPFPQAVTLKIGYDHAHYNLRKVSDTSGKVIYQSSISGIEDVGSETDNQSRCIYDLYGKAVKNPLPGSIYIVDGKKVIYE